MNVFRDYFAVNPWVFGVGANVGLFLILTTFGFGWMALFNVVTNKMYGDHCVDDKDCTIDMNYICQNGKCGCTSTTFFLSASDGCGALFKFLNILTNPSKCYLLFWKNF